MTDTVAPGDRDAMGDSDLLVAGEGLFTGDDRAGEGTGPERLAGVTDEVDEEVGTER